MSKPVRNVLGLLIDKGLVKWEKLEEKLHAALKTVDNSFQLIRGEGKGNSSKIRIEDAVSFFVNFEGNYYTYKLYCLRFRQGMLICDGFEMGRGKAPNVIWDEKSKVMF